MQFLVFNFLVNFGVAFTYPLFISVAMMLGIPLNAGMDDASQVIYPKFLRQYQNGSDLL